jgi:hypothetical protein
VLESAGQRARTMSTQPFSPYQDPTRPFDHPRAAVPDPAFRHPDRALPAAILISLGGAFLLANVLPGGMSGGLLLFAFGVAFTLARFAADRAGYAVPAGLLLGMGVFVATQDGSFGHPGGWVLICLGLGFLAAALIGWRAQTAWTLTPGLILVPLGIAVSDGLAISSLGQLAWLRQLWPVALILLGGWALLRAHIPEPRRTLLGVVGGTLLTAYALLAIGATIAQGPVGLNHFGRGFRPDGVSGMHYVQPGSRLPFGRVSGP